MPSLADRLPSLFDGTDQADILLITSRRVHRRDAGPLDTPIDWADHHGLFLWPSECNCDECGGWELPGDGHGPTASQRDIWDALGTHREVYVHAGHGVGKTFTGGGIVCWWEDAFDEAIAITTATRFKNLKRQLWKDIRKVHSQLALEGQRPFLTHWTPGGGEQADVRFAEAISTNAIEGLQGFHEGRVLYVIDEGSGCPEEAFDAGDRICIGEHDRMLVLTNPLRKSSITYSRMRQGRGRHLRITVEDCLSYQRAHPSVRLPLVSEKWLEETAKKRWGVNSVKYRIHVKGLYPEEDESYVFPPDVVDASMDAWQDRVDAGDLVRMVDGGRIEIVTPPDQIGVDVGGFGAGRTVWCARWGDELMVFLKQEGKTDHAKHRLEVKAFHQRNRPRSHWTWDAAGEGAGTAAELKADDVPIDVYKGGAEARDKTQFFNRRAESYFWLRDFVMNGGALPPSGELRDHLAAIEAELVERNVDRGGRGARKITKRYTVYKVTTKEKVVEKLGGSPDEGDASAMACAPKSGATKRRGIQVHGKGHGPAGGTGPPSKRRGFKVHR